MMHVNTKIKLVDIKQTLPFSSNTSRRGSSCVSSKVSRPMSIGMCLYLRYLYSSRTSR